jgi:hypothetical protein
VASARVDASGASWCFTRIGRGGGGSCRAIVVPVSAMMAAADPMRSLGEKTSADDARNDQGES